MSPRSLIALFYEVEYAHQEEVLSFERHLILLMCAPVGQLSLPHLGPDLRMTPEFQSAVRTGKYELSDYSVSFSPISNQQLPAQLKPGMMCRALK